MVPDFGTRAVSVVLALVLVIVGLFDLIATLWFPAGGTVSQVILSVSRAYPILPLAAGVLIGHLFWPQ